MLSAVFTKRKILIVIACGMTAIGLLVYGLQDEAQPTYQNYTLSEWLVEYDLQTRGIAEGNNEAASNAVVAVRHIGTNAVPFLLEWIRYEPTFLSSVPNWFWDKTPEFILKPIRRPYENSMCVENAFNILGTNAASAIPDLVRLLEADKVVSYRATLALAPLGKNAFPPLLKIISDPDHRLRRAAIIAIGRMGYLGTNVTPAIPFLIQCTEDNDPAIARQAAVVLGRLRLEPLIVVPVLTRCLAPTNEQALRRGALLGLENFGEEAKTAIPKIQQLLADRDPEICRCATNTLLKISAEALTNAPAQ